MKREFLQKLLPEGQALPKEAVDAIMAENGRDIQAARDAAALWEDKYNQAVLAHQEQLSQLQFDRVLADALRDAGGRNAKAIGALLELEQLKGAEDPAAAVADALKALKAECAYLFDSAEAPPPYARGTGTRQTGPEDGPQTLAGALREKMGKANRA